MKSKQEASKLEQDPHASGEAAGRLLEASIGREVRSFREKLGLTISELAKQAGFTQESFDKCLADDKLLTQIEAIRSRASEKFGVGSTPTFFINGKRLEGAPTIAAFDRAIEPLLQG